MSHLTKGKALSYLAAIFVAGAAAGAVVGYTSAKQAISRPPKTKEMSEHMVKRFQDRLNLTPAQAGKIRPLVEQASANMQATHRESLQRVSDIFKKMNQQIAEHLTDEQKAKLERMEDERRENVRKKCGRANGEGGTRDGRRSE